MPLLLVKWAWCHPYETELAPSRVTNNLLCVILAAGLVLEETGVGSFHSRVLWDRRGVWQWEELVLRVGVHRKGQGVMKRKCTFRVPGGALGLCMHWNHSEEPSSTMWQILIFSLILLSPKSGRHWLWTALHLFSISSQQWIEVTSFMIRPSELY